MGCEFHSVWISKFMPSLRMNFEIHAEALDEFRNSSSDGLVKKSTGTKYPFLSGGIRIPNFRIWIPCSDGEVKKCCWYKLSFLTGGIQIPSGWNSNFTACGAGQKKSCCHIRDGIHIAQSSNRHSRTVIFIAKCVVKKEPKIVLSSNFLLHLISY